MIQRSADSQCMTLLTHLQAGWSITARQASNMYGIDRCAARIRDLRDDKHNIHTEMVPVLNRDKKVVRIARYSIEFDNQVQLG